MGPYFDHRFGEIFIFCSQKLNHLAREHLWKSVTCDDVTGIDFNLDVQKVSVIAIEEILVIKGLSVYDFCGNVTFLNLTLRALAFKVDLVRISDYLAST